MIPEASIIICVYNGELYLEEALKSLLTDDLGNAEIVCLDDGSSDSTKSILEKYKSKVRYEFQPHQGIAAARNTAIKRSTGRLLAFLDADDLWVRGRLNGQCNRMKQLPGLSMVFGGLKEFISPDAAPLSKLQPREVAGARAIGTLLVKRDAYLRTGPFNESLHVAYFLDWFSRAQAAGLQAANFDEVVVLRRLHAQNQGIRERQLFAKEHVSALREHLKRKREGREGDVE